MNFLISFIFRHNGLFGSIIYVSVNFKPDHPPGDPRDSQILVAPGVCPQGVLIQNKSSIILKKARFSLCLLNKWVAVLSILFKVYVCQK